MRVETSDPLMLRGIVESIMVLQDEPKIRALPEGLTVRCMDPSRVALINLRVEREAFDVYECLGEEAFAVNLREAMKILKRADKGVKLALSLQNDKLDVEMHGRFLRRFSLPLLEGAEEENLGDPNVTFTAKVMLLVDDLIETLEDASLAGDVVKLEADENLFRISAKGDVSSTAAEIAKGSDALLSIEASKPTSAYFSLSYLTDIAKAASKIADIVEIHLADNMPTRIDFRTRFTGELKYFIAPRVEE